MCGGEKTSETHVAADTRAGRRYNEISRGLAECLGWVRTRAAR